MRKTSLTLVALLLSSLPVYAAGDADAAGSGGGLPQFDPTWYASQLFWLIIAFSFLYIFFSKKTLPEISSVIENRKDHIQADLDLAEKLTTEADSVQDAYENSLLAAKEQASQAIIDVEASMKQKAADSQEAFRQEAETQIKQTEKRLDEAKVKALSDMSAIASEAASAIVTKVTPLQVDAKKAQNVVDGLLNQNNKKAA